MRECVAPGNSAGLAPFEKKLASWIPRSRGAFFNVITIV